MPMRKLSKGWSTISNKYRNNVVSSRDRNREHAKNTRLRKKAYILKLKQLVEEMKKIKDVEDIVSLPLITFTSHSFASWISCAKDLSAN